MKPLVNPSLDPTTASGHLRNEPLARYQPPQGVHDEAFLRAGQPRAHWRSLLDELTALGTEELARRWLGAERQLRENGLTYTAFADPDELERPWQLDPVPLVIDGPDWTRLEKAANQRARLLDHIAADIYGPQELIADGSLPAALIHANPGFLRPLHGTLPARDDCHRIHLAAFDVARSNDGAWWVIGDRTQCPSLLGFALENRILLARTLPNTMQRCQVHRVATFFRAFQDRLFELAPRHRDDPRIVALTAGPDSSTYFEDVYLARYLGITPVQSGDLTVRDRAVYLKTLSGLLPVDVVLQRLEDSGADPLHAPSGATAGVPGLVDAVRSGEVAVANALGAGALESTAFMAFLPELCRRILGEELEIPSVATWWCGDERGRAHVMANLDRLVIRPAFGKRPVGVDGAHLSPTEREALRAKIETQPWAWVGQERVLASTAPSWSPEGVRAVSVVLRLFALASADHDYLIQPSGHVRTGGPDVVLGGRRSGPTGSKDVWVLSPEPVTAPPVSSFESAEVEIRRTTDLPSRVADDLFWLGRYVEQAESTARLLRAVVSRRVEEASERHQPGLGALAAALRYEGLIAPEEGAQPLPLPRLEELTLGAITSPTEPKSLRSVLSLVERSARRVRDRLSTDSWRILGKLTMTRSYRSESLLLGDALEHLDAVIDALSAFSGLVLESMTRGLSWQFLEIGRRLERAIRATSLLQGVLASGESDATVLSVLLEVADSSMTYRARYRSGLRLPAVVDLLLTDESNPRGVAFQVEALYSRLQGLPRENQGPILTQEERVALELLTALRLALPSELCRRTAAGELPRLTSLLELLSGRLPEIEQEITLHYLSHVERPQQLSRDSSDLWDSR